MSTEEDRTVHSSDPWYIF